MAKFCGKCGTRLDIKTGLCPKCDAEEIVSEYQKQRRKKRILAASIITLAIIAIGTAATMYALAQMQKLRLPEEDSPSEVTLQIPTSEHITEAETQSLETTAEPFPTQDPYEAYLENVIYPQYGQLQNELTIPYRGYYNQTENENPAASFFEIQDSLPGLLAVSKADYNMDAKEDLLVITLDDYAPGPFYEKHFGNLDGLAEISINATLYTCNEDGKVEQTWREQCVSIKHPRIKEAVSFYKTACGFVICSSHDRNNSFIDTKKELWFPLENLIATDHLDQIDVYELCNITQRGKAFSCWRNATNRGARYMSSLPGPVYLYSCVKWEEMQYSSEQEACEKLSSTLQNDYGIPDFELQPFSWKNRWGNSFLPQTELDGLICSISMESTATKQVSDHETGGSMTITVETPGYEE